MHASFQAKKVEGRVGKLKTLPPCLELQELLKFVGGHQGMGFKNRGGRKESTQAWGVAVAVLCAGGGGDRTSTPWEATVDFKRPRSYNRPLMNRTQQARSTGIHPSSP